MDEALAMEAGLGLLYSLSTAGPLPDGAELYEDALARLKALSQA